MAQTMIEKVAGLHAVGSDPVTVRSGAFLKIRPRHIMTHDNTSAVMKKFYAIGARRIEDPSQPVFAIDHDIQNMSDANLGKYASIEKFAHDHGVEYFPPGTGISHQVMVERGFVTPGALVVGSDSHSNLYGAINALGTPVVRTDAAAIWATTQTWWQVPKVARVTLRGTLPSGVVGKDVIIALCGAFNNDEVLNHAVEFHGDGVACLTMDQRMSVANMTTEWGALAGVFPFDDVLYQWLLARAQWLALRGTPRYTTEDVQRWWEDRVEADSDASYTVDLTLDLDSVIPHVSGPDHVKVMHALPEIEARRVEINKAYLLSCVNARLEDLDAAAAVMTNQQVAPSVSFYVAAASDVIEAAAKANGTWQTLGDAGAIFLPPGCGTCIGMGAGTLEAGEVGISATNRNFKGRMGSRDAQTYLASPAVVAASAIAGYICSPTQWEQIQPVISITVHTVPTPPGMTSIIDGFPTKITARCLWLGVDNLNTDGIYSGVMTYRDDVSEAEMSAAAMGNYDPDFASISESGDVIVSGLNFGTGSSREQAATCLKVRGIQCVIAASFSETYKRNAINNGFIVIDAPLLVDAMRAKYISLADLTTIAGKITIDFAGSVITWDGSDYPFAPMGEVPQEIIVAGGAEAVVRAQLSLS